jgi:hypothetical protein
VQPEPREIRQRGRSVLEDGDGGVEDRRRLERSWLRQDVSTRDLEMGDALEIQRGPLPRGDRGDGLPPRLDPADLDDPPRRQELELVAGSHSSRCERPGHDRPEPSNREGTIDRKTRPARRVSRLDADGRAAKRGDERRQPVPRAGADGDEIGLLEERAPDHLPHLGRGDLDELRVGEVGLGQSDDAPRQTEEPADLEVLAGLRPDRLVGGHDEQDQVDAARPCEHVLDESLMPRDIDEAQDEIGLDEVREAEIDRDAALRLRAAGGVRARERPDELALAMVDARPS